MTDRHLGGSIAERSSRFKYNKKGNENIVLSNHANRRELEHPWVLEKKKS